MSNIVKHIQLPDNNPIRFIRDDDPQAESTIHNSDWFANKIKFWNAKTNYYQKWEFNDWISVQIFVGGLYYLKQSFTKLQLLDSNKKVLAEMIGNYYGTLPGNLYYYEGVPYSMSTINFGFNANMYGVIKEGIYFLRLKVAHEYANATVYDYLVSEPLMFAAEHPRTILLEYISFSNKLNTDFTKWFAQIRFEGELKITDTPNQLNMYSDQKANPRKQRAIPYRAYTLKMGYPGGLPMWMYDKINNATSNDLCIVGGQNMERDINAEIEYGNKVARYDRFGASLKMLESDNEAASIKTAKNPLVLVTNSLTPPPFYIYSANMKNQDSGVSVNIWDGFEVNNDADKQSAVNVFNGWAIPNNKLTGKFELKDGNIVYINGIGENFDSNTTTVFTKKLTLFYKKQGGYFISPGITLIGKRGGIVPKDIGTCLNFGSATNVTNLTYSLLFYNPTNLDNTATYRIWHDNNITEFYVNPVSPTLNSITGDKPTTLIKMDINNSFFTSVFDLSSFPLTMQMIKIRNSNLSGGITGLSRNWAALVNFDVSGNKFNSAAIDNIFIAIQNFGFYSLANNGVFNTKFQSPPAPPTGASTTARNNYTIGHGWTLITD